MLESLRHSQDMLGIWLVICTALIGVGIVGEDWDKLSDLACALFEWLKDDPFDRSKLKVPLMFAMLVAIGVIGEAIIEFELPIVEQGIRTESDKQLATLRSAAELASARAANADKETARLTSENLKLEALIQPRSLTSMQRDEIATTLSQFGGRKVIVMSHAYDPDGYWFSRQLIQIFTRAKLVVDDRVIGLGGVSGMGSFSTDLGLVVAWSPGQEDLACKIADGLGVIGHVHELTVVPISGPGEISVTVNWKPLPSL